MIAVRMASSLTEDGWCSSSSIERNGDNNTKPAIVFTGNAGSGKSTLLNCLFGRIVFNGGEGDDGEGRTKKMITFENDEYIFVDTPGLNDIKRPKEVAKEVTKAFRTFSKIVLVFVCQVHDNRVRPEEANSFRRIVNSLLNNDCQHKIVVVFNKLTPKWHKQYTEDNAKAAKIVYCIMGRTIQPKDLVLLKRSDDLEDMENAMIRVPELKSAIDRAPVIDIVEGVNAIQDGDQSREIEKLQNEIRERDQQFSAAMATNEAQLKRAIEDWKKKVQEANDRCNEEEQKRKKAEKKAEKKPEKKPEKKGCSIM